MELHAVRNDPRMVLDYLNCGLALTNAIGNG